MSGPVLLLMMLGLLIGTVFMAVLAWVTVGPIFSLALTGLVVFTFVRTWRRTDV